ncbi:MAG: ATP-binding protein [Acidobacteria bacterium]|nr:ATP-binding protein [Acidobacteriota bacterium]
MSSMREQRSVNPFVPGRGVLPPCLAGRDAEQRELMRLLAYLQAGRGAPRDAVVSGPRGNGKTVLLRWLQGEIEADGEIDVVWRTPSDLPALDALATALAPPERFRSLLPDKLSVSIGIGRLGWELGGDPGTLTDLLTLRCGHRPLVVLLDEAHTLDVAVGRALLNAGQSTAAAAPFLLVLAGTPGLTLHLDRMSATFWNRAKHIGVGLLDEDAAAAALVRPLAEQDPAITFDAAALRRVLDESQCYPYFLQLWGAALWDAATQQAAEMIDEAVVEQASRAFEVERNAYYEHRRDELERQNLLPVAGAIADAFAGRAMLAQDDLNGVIADALALDSIPETVQRRDRLALVGYVWKPPGAGDRWQPGIPSLMRYLRSPASSSAVT